MLSATAPTALAEERVRGSLDVLLATPLATHHRSGKVVWFLQKVLTLLPLPLLAAVFLAAAEVDRPIPSGGLIIPPPPTVITGWDRVLMGTIGTADFLASGAAIVSLGLSLAIWVRRLGRAVVLLV